MTEPVRWSNPDSEASPELRSMLAYARAGGPDAAQLAALTESVLAGLPSTEAQREPQHSTAPGDASSAPQRSASAWSQGPVALGAKLAALVAVASLLAAWALWGPRTGAPAARERAQVAAKPPVPAHELPLLSETLPDAQIQLAPASEARPRQRAARRERAARDARGPDASPDAAPRDAASELALLHAARIARRSSAQTALQLLQEHERRFPKSELQEEREVLMIELLQRLDPPKAARRLAAFEARFPSSAYREGLRKGR